MEQQAFQQFKEEGAEEGTIMFSRFLDIRYVGQEHTVKVPVSNGVWTEEAKAAMIRDFHRLHEKNYTFKLEGQETEIVNMHLVALARTEKPALEPAENKGTLEDALIEQRPVYYEEEGWVPTNVYRRSMLPTREVIAGPAIVEEEAAVTVIYSGQSLYADPYGNLIIHTGVDSNV
jgi:N-methylhydantoinase A